MGQFGSLRMSSRSTSPFWRQRPTNSRNGPSKSKAYDPNVVVGASYSHADMLKFDSLYILCICADSNSRLTYNFRALTSSSSRPRTPPSSSHSTVRNTNTPPSRRPSSALSNTPSRLGYSTSLRKDSDWLSNDEEDEGEEDDHADYDLNEDEDEFGLPSIANARRAARRAGGPSLDILGDRRHHVIPEAYLSSGTIVPGRSRANSTDIAEERGTPSYPIPRKSEGKILRPQYKDILRGSYFVHLA